MWFRNYQWFSLIGAITLAAVCLSGCGGDDDDSTDTSTGGKSASTGSGGTSDTTTGSGGSRSTAGSAGIPDWRSLFDAAALTEDCSEPASTAAVVCGGTTCTALSATMAFTAPCIKLCCANKDGAEVCGAKDTTKDAPEPCQTAPVADSRCKDYTYEMDDGTGPRAGSTGSAGSASSDGGQRSSDAGTGTVKGCCNPDNKCGIVSTMRPLCVTKSSLIDLPATPPACL
jgi:hypothetical protein